MTASTGVEDLRRRRRLRSAAQAAIAALTVAAVVLAVLVWQAAAGGPTVTADAGEKVPLRTEPYGRPVTILLPGSEITVTVGGPVETIDHELLEVEYDDPRWDDQQDLGAPDGGTLVPVTWRTRALGGFLRKGDPNPIAIRLVAGDRRVDLDSVVLDDTGASLDAYDARSFAVAVDGDVRPGDLAIEVEYDGLTQTADVDTGDVDAGVAQALYEDGQDLTAGCTEVSDRCQLTATDASSPLRPDAATFTTSHLTLYPYDPTLGWADEGTLWAGVRLQMFGASGVENAAGDYWSVTRQSAPVLSLDGAEPVRREGLKAGGLDSVGRVVFTVDTGDEPRELRVEQVLSLRGPGSPPDLPVRADLDLRPVG